MAIYSGRILGERLCRLLNVDPSRVASITLSLSPREPARIILTMDTFVYDSDRDLFDEIEKEYELTLIERPKPIE